MGVYLEIEKGTFLGEPKQDGNSKGATEELQDLHGVPMTLESKMGQGTYVSGASLLDRDGLQAISPPHIEVIALGDDPLPLFFCWVFFATKRE